MNILILSWRGPGHPDAGGAEISTHEHAKGWVKVGHNVTLFTSSFIGGKKEEIIDGVNIIRRGGQILGVHLEVFKWYIFENHQKYDLVIDQFHGIPFFTPIFVKTKKLAFIHEVTKEVWKFNQLQFPANVFVATIGFLVEPLIFKLYRNISFMSMSESTKRDLIEWGIPDKNITIIHNGINQVPLKHLPDKEFKKTIIYLGALAKDKGIEVALRVFSMLNTFSELHFWVVGKVDPKYFKKIKFLSEKLLLKDRIKFWGYVSEKKKFELLARSYILLNPSIREGWGLVVLEAARVGTPAVAFNAPGLRDSIRDGKTGLLSKQFTPDSLTSEIVSLLDNKKKYYRMCHNAMIWSRRFSWDNAVKLSIDLITKLAS